MYHPNVDMSSGAICVNTLKKDWTVQTTLSHVLNVIRCLLIVPFPESSLNDEAGRLFMESYDEYSKRARLMADVHGRNVEVEPTTSASAAAAAALPGTVENGSDERISSNNSNVSSSSGRSRGVLKSSLDSTNNTTVTSSVETGSSASTAKKQKGNNASGKLGKKKSLKRL
jgi:ubiquitin-conjugating enzyme E2 S